MASIANMHARDKFELHFVTDSLGEPALEACILRTHTTGNLQKEVEVKSINKEHFEWNGKEKIRLFALAIVRVALWQHSPMGLPGREQNDKRKGKIKSLKEESIRVFDPPIQASRGGESETSTAKSFFNLASYKECPWLGNILDPGREWMTKRDDEKGANKERGRGRFKEWFRCHHYSEATTTTVYVPFNDADSDGARGITPEHITIRLDGNVADHALCDWIETRLAARVDMSFPPQLGFGRYAVDGRWPHLGSDFWGRESDMLTLGSLYSRRGRAMEVIGPRGGEGKSTLIRHWLRKEMGQGMIHQELVFAWDIPFQFTQEGVRTTSYDLEEALKRVLKVTPPKNASPKEKAGVFLNGMRSHPTLLWLDGLEALLDTQVSYALGATQGRGDKESFADTLIRYLIEGMLSPDGPDGSYLLIGSRVSIGSFLAEKQMEIQHLEVGPLERTVRGGRPDDTAIITSILDVLNRIKGVALPPDESTVTITAPPFSKAPVSDRVRYLVKVLLEEVKKPTERALLYTASLFDQCAATEIVMHVLSQDGMALAEACRGASEEDWERARDHLMDLGLLSRSEPGVLAFNPVMQGCIYEQFKSGMAADFVTGHRLLYEYFSHAAPELPDTIGEMRPLFRACWHGCQAGMAQEVFTKISYPRLSRGWQTYIVLHLGEYQEALNMLSYFTSDGQNFEGNLSERDKGTVLNGTAICLRYSDQISEAKRVGFNAWNRLSTFPNHPHMLPSATHLLRVLHMFGDLHDTGPVLDSMLRGALKSIKKDAQKERVPKSYVAQAIGYVTGMAALVQACKGKRVKAHIILKSGWVLARLAGCKNKHILPGRAAPYHALALLELGRWKDVLNGEVAGEFDRNFTRFVHTRAIDFVVGKALSMSKRPDALVRAKSLLTGCLEQAKDRPLKWWWSSALCELAEVQFQQGDYASAISLFREVLELKVQQKVTFRLLEVQAHTGLARCYDKLKQEPKKKEHAQAALQGVDASGYKNMYKIALSLSG